MRESWGKDKHRKREKRGKQLLGVCWGWGQIGPEPEVVNITDDMVLIENHGYDEYSFRSKERV